MVLPPVETTPVIFMRFTDKAKPDMITVVKERLSDGGMVLVLEEQTEDGSLVLGLSTSQAELEAEAEHVQLLQPTNDPQPILEYFTIAQRNRFVDHNTKEERDSAGLFGFNEWACLTWTLLDSINVFPPGDVGSNLSRKLDQEKVPYLHHTESSLEFLSMPSNRRLFHQEGHTPTNENTRSESLRHVLQESGFIDVVAPADLPRLRKSLIKDTLRWRDLFNFKKLPDPDKIRDYYGEEVAFYFAWMNHFTLWLCIPGIVGFITYAVRWYRGDSIDEDEYTPFYGVAVFIWAVLFARFWDREEHRLAYRWGTFSTNGYEKATKLTEIRPEFDGVLRKSPVTGLMELYYSPRMRGAKYAVSAFVTVIMLWIAFCVMVMSLNLQGYIDPDHNPERWNDGNGHPFHFRFLQELSDKGKIFDMNSSWRSLLPVLLHVISIFTMNSIYRMIAERLTNWENHETVHSFKNSLILKRFLFEAFDCYVALFYLAFYEHDIEKLRFELVSVFIIDTFRRLALECILPMVSKRFNKAKTVQVNRLTERKKFDISNDGDDYALLSAEANLDEYEQFDDYLEMVIELGYVCLFASAYPLASLIAVVANLIEMRADLFKITYLCRRPRSNRASGIGMWKTLIECIIWMSAFTNCFIFGFTSQQMAQWLPDFYYQDSLGFQRLVAGKGWIVVMIIFALERLLLYTALCINQIIPSVPEDVSEAIERREYIRSKTQKALSEELQKARRQRSRDLSELNVDGQ